MRKLSLSFDQPGFLAHQARFKPDDLDVDMSGKVCLVTGATSGLGLATCRALSALGAQVWMLCRDSERGARLRDQLRQDTGNSDIHIAIVDLASQRSVIELADQIPSPHIDVLVNNAGVLPDERAITEDDLELTLATNLVSPFLLAHRLLPRLRAAQTPRVISVSSGGMYTKRLDLRRLEGKRGRFSGLEAYAQTKRAQVVLNELWAEKSPDGRVEFHAMHPGWADTRGVKSSIPRFWRVMRRRLRTAEQGADTIVWLSAVRRVPGKSGSFWFDRQIAKTYLLPFTRETREAREQLWQQCCQWANIAHPESQA